MEALIRTQELESDRCAKCGKQPGFVTSMLDPPTGRTFYMLKCQCGEKTCLSLSSGAVAGHGPTSVGEGGQ